MAGPLSAELVERLEPLIADDNRRREMAARMGRLACPEAAANVSDVICNLLCREAVRLAA
jgi:hypothetical protein